MLTATTQHSADTAAPKRLSAQRVSAKTFAPKCPAPCQPIDNMTCGRPPNYQFGV